VSWQADGGWKRLTWSEYRERAAEAAMGLRALGVGHGDFVAIMARNRVEHLVADLGAVHAGATAVSIYNTLAPEQIQYIAENCGAKVAVVEGREFMERWEKIKAELPALEHVVLIDDAAEFADYDWVTSWDQLLATGREALQADGGREAFEATWRKATPEDPVTLIYTSGTTGPPKGVIITHRNALWTAESLVQTAPHLPDGMEAVSYLPLAHIAERVASLYLAIRKAGHMHMAPDIMNFIHVVEEVRPQLFFGVPRVWEKVQAGIVAALHEEPNERKRKIALGAIEAGREAVRLEQAGKTIPFGLQAKRAIFDKLVFKKIRSKIGLDRCILAATAAAPISLDTLEFFAGIGLTLHEIYGMTEDTGPATSNRIGAVRLGTVGVPLPGVEVTLAEDGEILVRGGVVSPGYYNDAAKTAETFDQDGWLHTGDIGRWDDHGYLKVVDRKKELIITAGGKNISPANLEALLKRHPLVGQACVVGDGRKYVAALLVLDGEVAPGWAKEKGISFQGVADLASEERVLEELETAVNDANQHVSQVEQIKRWSILPTEWTVDSDELTPTLKLKRRVIHQKYADEIEALYS
jgi:long-chain acyl-CoA synthetase